MIPKLGIALCTLVAFAFAPFPAASAYECGPVGTYWSTQVNCDLFCNQYHYLYVKADDTNANHYVRGSVNCGGDSGACGAYDWCDVWTTTGASYQQNGVSNCHAERDYILSTLTVYCKSTGSPGFAGSAEDLPDGESMYDVTMVVTELVGVGTRCVHTNQGSSCAPTAVVCRIDGMRQVCDASFASE